MRYLPFQLLSQCILHWVQLIKSVMRNNYAGFTLIEIIVSIAILSVLLTIGVSGFVIFKKTSDLDNGAQEFVSSLRSAQNKTLLSNNYSQYGIYLDSSVFPNRYILFQGDSYALRTPSADKIYLLNNSLEFNDISLGGGSEIVFEKLTGASQENGSISIRLKAEPSLSKTIYISSSGAVGFDAPADLLDEDRLTDSRHVHFNYDRVIDTLNGSITLTFDGSQTRDILISSFLDEGQINWQDTVSVDGSDQIVAIRTHKLNDSGTIFSIHRDKRYNDKSLKITISGDITGSLIEYSATGETSSYSIYTSNIDWQ